MLFKLFIFVGLFIWKNLEGFRMQRSSWTSLRTWNPQRVSDLELELELESELEADKLRGRLHFFQRTAIQTLLYCSN